MRERVWSYLRQANRPVSAGQILRDVLKIRSPNAAAANRVLGEILRKDPRFLNVNDLWQIQEPRAAIQTGLENISALFLRVSRHPRVFQGAVHAADPSSSWSFRVAVSDSSSDTSLLGEARSHLQGRVLLLLGRRDLGLFNALLRSQRLDEWRGDTLFLRSLVARILDAARPPPDPEDLAAKLDLRPPDQQDLPSMARFYYDCLQTLLEAVPPEHRRDLRSLRDWIGASKAKVDFSRFAFGPEFLRRIPAVPGVYIMRNRASDIIYVGKASNLARRVRSYFTRSVGKDPKASRIHEQLYTVEVVPTASEIEALLMEMRMIRDFSPPLNLQAQVHESPAAYGQPQNLIVLVREPEGQRATAYFLRRCRYQGRQTVHLGRKPTKLLRKRIREIFFSPSSGAPESCSVWESELISRWLKRKRHSLNFIDVDAAGGCASVLKLLTSYLQDPDGLSQKVFYR